jgi:predicted amidohydrolase
MKTVRIAAAQTAEFREDIEAALECATEVAARARAEGVSLLCFPEGFLQGYLTEEAPARRNALNLTSPAFLAILKRLPKTGPMIVMGLIEVESGRLFNTAIVVDRGVLVGRYRKTHLFCSEHIFNAGSSDELQLVGGECCFDAGSESPIFEANGLRFGINICYDTNFPEAARKVADLGASLIVCPANNMCRRKIAEALKDAHNRIRGERCLQLWVLPGPVVHHELRQTQCRFVLPTSSGLACSLISPEPNKNRSTLLALERLKSSEIRTYLLE